MILHITNDFAGSKVYVQLIQKLDEMGVEQIVFTPVKTAESVGKNQFEFQVKSSRIIYANILNQTTDRFFYRWKIHKILREIEKQVDFSKISLIHAHTWYSDGGVAFLLHQKYRLPYLVAVQNTDLNIFYRFLPHERTFGRKILLNASKIILVSASYKKRLLEFPINAKFISELSKKMQAIPFGLANFWLENLREKPLDLEDNAIVRVLYVGKFSHEKNVPNLLRGVLFYNEKYSPKIHLQIIGGGGVEAKEAETIIAQHPSDFTFLGSVTDKEKLKEFYRANSLFAMPSRRESFGLVYVEALSQGLPVLYTEGEGIDGFFQQIGEKVPKNATAEEISNAFNRLILHYSTYEIPHEQLKKQLNWQNIAEIYREIYDQLRITN